MMRNAFWIAIVWLLCFACNAHWVTFSGPSVSDKAAPHAPEMVDSFAVSSLWGGQVWPVFLHGYDLDGDMKYLWIVLTRLGSMSQKSSLPQSSTKSVP